MVVELVLSHTARVADVLPATKWTVEDGTLLEGPTPLRHQAPYPTERVRPDLEGLRGLAILLGRPPQPFAVDAGR